MERTYNNAVKKIRARVIKQYLNAVGSNECVCFSCGNASRELLRAGLYVTEVLNPDRWWQPEEIQNAFKMFDATSGHLPMFLMAQIANEGRAKLKEPKPGLIIPTGSGETFVVLKMAWPGAQITPVYNLDNATKYNDGAPLNWLVNAIVGAPKIVTQVSEI